MSSRLPHSRSNPSLPKQTLSPRPRTVAASPTKGRAKSPAKPSPLKARVQDDPPKSAPALSIREAIALKRAEAKKAQAQSRGGLDNVQALEDATPITSKPADDEDILGRYSLREAIERARSTGSVNLATRSLPCLPSGLFEIHLGITPDPLKSVPNEPPLPPPSEAPAARRGMRRDSPAWYEAQDLQVLKAWNNEIIEIQPEISLFGSLKVVDLHQNKIESLPSSFADLSALTTLDLSHNALASVPDNLWALPELVSLNLSHNALISLPFKAPFSFSSKSATQQTTSFFMPVVTRATSPLPRLSNLDVSHNKIAAHAIDSALPANIVKLNLSFNPLEQEESPCQELLHILGSLGKLKELRLERAEISDTSLPPTLFTSPPFPALRLLDLEETKVTEESVKLALRDVRQPMRFDFTTDEPPDGVLQIVVGKRIIRETWEIEAEQRAKARAAKTRSVSPEVQEPSLSVPKSAVTAMADVKPTREAVREPWEIEAEQGLLTEGGRRRARAAAADKEQTGEDESRSKLPADTYVSPTQSQTSLLTSPQYYDKSSQTLTLPPSTALNRAPGHARTFSVALAPAVSKTSDIALPAPTLPLVAIAAQSYAQTLKILILANRKLDRCFDLPAVVSSAKPLLPNLEELSLEGCGLNDNVLVVHSKPANGTSTPPRVNEPILPLLARLFPGLGTLDLSYNALTSSSLTAERLTGLLLASSPDESPVRKGLKHFRLRGNRLTELDGLQMVAQLFKGNREVPGWKLEELDVRDNEIGKLPPELGLMPLDVFLVDGNLFRVPQRRVWEREGTKGLLSWLRGRIE